MFSRYCAWSERKFVFSALRIRLFHYFDCFVVFILYHTIHRFIENLKIIRKENFDFRLNSVSRLQDWHKFQNTFHFHYTFFFHFCWCRNRYPFELFSFFTFFTVNSPYCSVHYGDVPSLVHSFPTPIQLAIVPDDHSTFLQFFHSFLPTRQSLQAIALQYSQRTTMLSAPKFVSYWGNVRLAFYIWSVDHSPFRYDFHFPSRLWNHDYWDVYRRKKHSHWFSDVVGSEWDEVFSISTAWLNFRDFLHF